MENLIIVAHPDDEAIWFSSILKEPNSGLVVVMQNQYPENIEQNKEHTKKAFEIMDMYNNILPTIWLQTIKTTQPKITGDIPKETYQQVKANLKGILEMIQPKNVYTHNPKGEYGHSEHKMIHHILKELCKEKLIFHDYKLNHNEFQLVKQRVVDNFFREALFNLYKERDIWTGELLEPMHSKETYYKYR